MTDKPIEELVSSYDIPKREEREQINPFLYKPLKKLGSHSIDEEGKLVKEDGESKLTQQVKARKSRFENFTPPYHNPVKYMTREEVAGVSIGFGLGATAGMISRAYDKVKENLISKSEEEVAGSLKDRSFTKKSAGATLVGAGLAYGAKKGVEAFDKARDLLEDARSYF